MDYFQLMGFGPDGWGYDMLKATGMTVAVAFSGFAIGLVFGCLGAAASFQARALFRQRHPLTRQRFVAFRTCLSSICFTSDRAPSFPVLPHFSEVAVSLELRRF